LKNRCAYRRRTAVSTVVSAVLMAAIAVSLSTVVHYWATGSTGTLERANTQVYDNRKEAITIEKIWMNKDGTTELVVRNVGVLDTGIGAIYVDGVLKYSAPSEQGAVIKVGGTASFLVSGISAAWHSFKVATMRGNIASQWWGPPEVVTAETLAMTATGSTTGTFTTGTTSMSTSVTTITIPTTYTTVTTRTTTYARTTSTFRTTYTSTYVTTWTYLCSCTTETYTTTKTTTCTSTGTTTISTTSTTIITTTVTTYITTTSSLP